MIVKGNDFVTKEQFCSLCHISKKTAYKLIKSGRIKATKRICGLLHYYEIPISEISRLQKIRGNICKLDKEEIRKVRKYYSEKLKKYPDIRMKMLQGLTECLPKHLPSMQSVEHILMRLCICAREQKFLAYQLLMIFTHGMKCMLTANGILQI